MARRLIAAAAASALLLIPQASALAQVPNPGPLPGQGGGTPTVPKVEVPNGGPELPGGAPRSGGSGPGGAAPGGAGPARAPAPAPAPRGAGAPRSPTSHKPDANQPARAPSGAAVSPAGLHAGRAADAHRDGRAQATRQSSSGTGDAGRGRSNGSGKSDPKEQVEVSTAARIFEQVPAGVLTALAISSLLAAMLSLVWLRERYTIRTERRRALRDPLTGIGNRLAFEQRLAHEFKRARRYGRPLGMLLLDVDGLKLMNDTEGHGAGDDLLRSVAGHITTDIRDPDLGARLAGDEFVVLCPETPIAGMEELGGKLERGLEEAGVSASIGCAELREDDSAPEDMVGRADAAMYLVKQSRGGRRVEATAQLGLATAT